MLLHHLAIGSIFFVLCILIILLPLRVKNHQSTYLDHLNWETRSSGASFSLSVGWSIPSMFVYLYHRWVHLHIYFWFYIMFVLSLMLVLTQNFYYFSAAVLITRMVWRWVLSTCLFLVLIALVVLWVSENFGLWHTNYLNSKLYLSLIHLQILCIIWLYELGCKQRASESISLTVHTLIEHADTDKQTQTLNTDTHRQTHTQRTVMQLVLSSLHTQIEMKLSYSQDLVVGYMGVPKYAGVSMTQHPQYITVR